METAGTFGQWYCSLVLALFKNYMYLQHKKDITSHIMCLIIKALVFQAFTIPIMQTAVRQQNSHTKPFIILAVLRRSV